MKDNLVQTIAVVASRSTRAMILCTAAMTAVMALPRAGYAQTAATQTATTQDNSGAVGELVVTGSRLARTGLDTPTPVEALSDLSLRKTGTQDLGQLLAQQPAVTFGGTPQAEQNAGSAGTPGEFTGGLSLANLRGLGTNRTLTLVDGKRQVGSDPGNTAFDLNSLSTFLVKRIEVVTGGASAVYGSDAVTGVVNIITRDDLEGVEYEVRGSHSTETSGGATRGLNVAAGTAFAQHRGNVMVAVGWDRTDALQASQQPQSLNYSQVANPNYTATNGQPNTLLLPGAVSPQYYYAGDLNYNGAGLQPTGIAFDANGKVSSYPTATGIGSLAIYRTFATPCPLCFGVDDWYTLIPSLDRKTANISAHYDLADGTDFTSTVYGNFNYARRESTGNGQPLEDTISINVAQNAFLDPVARAQLQAAGLSTATLTKAWSDLGGRESTDIRQTFQFNAGLKGHWNAGFSDIRYDAYANIGETAVNYIGDTRFYAANVLAAADSVINPATGQAACRINVPSLQPAGYVAPAIIGSAASCAPVNPFGTSVSQAAKAFVSLTTDGRAWLTQDVGGLSMSGDTSKFLTLWGGGAIGFATGYEFRKEGVSYRWDPAYTVPITTQAGLQVNSDASYTVNELYGEADVPFVKDKPFAKLISIDMAGRFADYSTVKGVSSYKFGPIWAPTSDFRFRATYSRAVRAPNLTEADSPVQIASSPASDPCSTVLINVSATRKANCAALGIPANFAGNPLSIPVTTSGNANLKPERSDSYTAGIVLTPRFIPGLSVTVDYYNIKIKDAITLLTGSQIVNACVDSTNGPDKTFCSLVTRNTDPTSPSYGFLTAATSTYINASKLESRGVDFQANYHFALFGGQMTTGVSGTRLIQLRNYVFQDNPSQYTMLDGYIGNPVWKANPQLSYAIGGWSVVLSGRYFSHQALIDMSPGQNANFQDVKYAPAEYYQDLYVEKKLHFYNDMSLFAGVTNLFATKLPPINASLQGLDSGYDEMGAVVFAGLRGKF
jgi:outer membrane receptor protein involved in Fe transport